MRILSLVLMLGLVLAACSKKYESTAELKSKADTLSYSIGLDIGKSFKDDSLNLNLDLIAQGIHDGLTKDSGVITEEQVQAAIAAMQQDVSLKRQERSIAEGKKNQTDGEKFLAENKSKPGVVTTASGLQYKVIKQGGGATPTLADNVVAHYRGTSLKGKEFDNSHKRNQPATFPVQGVIPGWTEVLQLMKVGSTYEVWIPGKLAYGPGGAGGVIGPNETLHFEIELLDVKPQGAATPPPGH
jgi:FKBP-type peptidyl-prolyl cis-trans isomerase FklB